MGTGKEEPHGDEEQGRRNHMGMEEQDSFSRLPAGGVGSWLNCCGYMYV